MSERNLGLRVAAGLAATVLANGAVGCGSDGTKYSKRSEKKLEQIITPQMRHIARSAIHLERDSHGQVTARYLGNGRTEVSGVTTTEAGLNDNNGLDGIDAVMLDYQGTKKPNPNSVLLADVGYANNVTNKGFSTDGEEEFIAADQGNLAHKVLIAEAASDQVLDTKGWTALGTDYSATNGIVNGGLEEDTADASEFSQDPNFNPTNPVATARNIVSQVPDTLTVVIDDFKG